MARSAAVATPLRDDQDSSHAPAASKTSKRRCVSSACVPCRKRKSKCDGGTPFCATCTAVYKTECHYDPESESRRIKSSASSSTTLATKRDASVVSISSLDHATNAEFIIDNLRNLPEEHVSELIQHIRRDLHVDTTTLAETWRKNFALPPSTPVEIRSLESDLSVLLGKPILMSASETRLFGQSASLDLVSDDENFGCPRQGANNVLPGLQGTTWSSVTNDVHFVERLLHLYFTWSHPFYVLFSRECFYKDFRCGREKYCSSLLVNAICAYACHLTDEPAGRTDPSNFRTAGDHFFAEARRLLFEDETPCLTTIQALCVMALREPSTGRDSTGFSYIGRCIRMCVELGLHLDNNVDPCPSLTPSEVEVRKVTFWGCFTVDTVYSICTGRIAQLPRAAITLEKPILEESATIPDSRVPSGPVTLRMFLQEFASLSELVNDINYIFFAPKERLTSTRLVECYGRYQAWYRRLPALLGVEGKPKPEPHILVLHMLYHTIIVHLFRPMLKVELIHSDVVPRDLCIDAANNVSRLVRIYRSFYDFRQAHLIIPHILLSVCVVHLLFSKENKVSRQNLVEGLQGLEDLHECHYFGARSFKIIHALATTWNLPWPEELRHSRLVPKVNYDKPQGTVSPPADPLMVAPNTMSIAGSGITPAMSYSPIAPQRRESLSMFAKGRMQLATHSANSRSSSAVSSQNVQSPMVGRAQAHNNFSAMPPLSTYSYPQSLPSVTAPIPSTNTSSTSDAAEAMFWNPIPGLPGPILPRTNYQQIGPMGLQSVLQRTDMGDRLGRDGFKINEDWHSRHVNGFAPSASGSVYGTGNEQPGGGYGQQAGSYVQASDRNTCVPGPSGQDDYVPGWWHSANGDSGPMS
ncbi:hypothetical protein ACN47E_010094 [Coniothyrium glycines]